MSETTMDLVVIDAQNAVQIFTGGGLNAILDGIEAKVRAIPLDPSTAPGREEIRSVAYRVSRTKVALDNEGKRLTEGWREATARVNQERKRSTERLDALAEEVRKPLTDFENKERIRAQAHEEALAEITGLHALLAANPDMSLDSLLEHQAAASRLHLNRLWEEFEFRAKAARESLEKYISQRLEARKKFEVEQEELARLRKAEAERIQRERDDRLRAEAAEKQRIESERKAALEAEAERARVAFEAERARREAAEAADKARREHEEANRRAAELFQREEQAKLDAEKRAKDAEEARIAAEKKAEVDRIAALNKAKEAIRVANEKAKRDAEAAALRERALIESERKTQEAWEAKRAADKAHKAKIRGEIIADIKALDLETDDPDCPNYIAEAIIEGKIRHIKVVY